MLNFSLRIIVCEIFFHMRSEQKLFKMSGVNNSMTKLIGFLHKTLKMNIEQKPTLVSNALRLLSEMIHTIHEEPDAAK